MKMSCHGHSSREKQGKLHENLKFVSYPLEILLSPGNFLFPSSNILCAIRQVAPKQFLVAQGSLIWGVETWPFIWCMIASVLMKQPWRICVNTFRPRQNGCHFPDDTFKRIFLNENIRISTKNSLKFVPKDLINNIPALVLIMAWRRPGDKPLSEPMLVKSLKHICVTRPQWVNGLHGYTKPFM